ncbi:hypothetical protein PTSG_08230 [Salpingoeca rosetta]|uniref:Methyltransferase domain-containing protein n=1 Tax=Salpingoeca rosetta (strain ATCC 50818 / BSB-021) TaxID=946362 RepID=F2UID4_SALR5|nr:uncharacterized protein PTSG_08230 [Salpingoeca rosetta]EGD76883.1 hypothetical protein PTSG_08230 [Salpingoeca rosetta]|eukprot:XP_004991255.1 hypothetical protein PTSG_08230 [Salpingoeca rosetta]
MPSSRSFLWVITTTGAAAFAAGIIMAKIMFQSTGLGRREAASDQNSRPQHHPRDADSRRRIVHMTPSVFETLTHQDCLRYLAEAGIPQSLLDSVPECVDGAIMIECATPDKFSFSTADKLFWVQIENSDACKRIAAVLDEMIAAHPHDLPPDAASPSHPTPAPQPETPHSNYTVTSNRCGMMSNEPSAFMHTWIARAESNPQQPMMDIGCAYGVATLGALEKGARVIAIDLEPNHLASVQTAAQHRNIPKARLRCIEGGVPETLAELRSGSVSHVLAANVFHFLSPTALTRTLKSLHRVMASESFLHIQVDSPFMRGLGAFYYVYALRKFLGHHFPGYLPIPESLQRHMFPDYLHVRRYQVMDADVLRAAVERAGFEIVRAGYEPVDDESDILGISLDGRESTVVVAVKR